MSYARFSADCNVSVFLGEYGLVCWVCALPGTTDNVILGSTAEMIAHLEKHVEHGHLVPDDVFEWLLHDAAENDAEIAGV